MRTLKFLFISSLCAWTLVSCKSSSNVVSSTKKTETIQQSVNSEANKVLTGIVDKYTVKAREVSLLSNGRIYTDHNAPHAILTGKKVVGFMKAVNDAIQAGKFTPSVEHDFAYGVISNELLLTTTGMMHDLGMGGDGYYMKAQADANGNKLTDENGLIKMERDEKGAVKMFTLDNKEWSTLRSNHSLNGCLHFLLQRQAILQIGLTDKEIDMIAAAIFGHSKSTCDIRNLTKANQWKNAFDKIDALVGQYNKEHPNATISFNRKSMEGDSKAMGQLASLTLALRVGDVSRDSHPDDICQSGETIHVDYSSYDANATNWKDEVKTAKVTVSGEPINTVKDLQVFGGEQNISFNDNYYDSKQGCIVHEITIIDANTAIYSTMEAINDHVGEFKTAVGIPFAFKIVVRDSKATDANKPKWQQLKQEISYPVDMTGL